MRSRRSLRAAGRRVVGAAPCRFTARPDPMAATLSFCDAAGNLEDSAARAPRAEEAALIRVRDTLRPAPLTHFCIPLPVTSYFEPQLRKLRALLETLHRPVVWPWSPTRTPHLDPGFPRHRRGGGHPVVPVPGPSRWRRSLSAPGVPPPFLLFEGSSRNRPARARWSPARAIAGGSGGLPTSRRTGSSPAGSGGAGLRQRRSVWRGNDQRSRYLPRSASFCASASRGTAGAGHDQHPGPSRRPPALD